MSAGFTLGGMGAAARGSIGWRHAFGGTMPLSTQAFPAANVFTVAGVPIARDSAIVEAGFDLILAPAARFASPIAGSFASQAQDHGFTASLTVSF